MDVNASTPLLAGLTPAQFMRRHWEKKPLLVRQAWPGVKPPLSRASLFKLAASDDVESRLVVREAGQWLVRHGPMPRRVMPAVSQPGWTLLVQGLDLHVDAAHALLQPFDFIPAARLDDLMVSWASDGGGVGPHVDTYDVFLLQVAGRRRWRVGRVADPAFIEDLPLKILQRFEPEFEWTLEAGDMLYLPPMWGHDGVADGECMTCSVGFRSPQADALADDLLQRLAEADEPGLLYRDPAQPATEHRGEVPAGLATFARAAVARRLRERDALERALGESLSDPKPQVWFAAQDGADMAAGLRLDRRTRMLYDSRHVYINGESFRISGRDARQMRKLADTRCLDAMGCASLSPAARHIVQAWLDDGWLQPEKKP